MNITLSPKKIKFNNYYFNLKKVSSIEEVLQLSDKRTYDFFYDNICRPNFCNLGCWIWETDDIDIIINPVFNNYDFCHFEVYWINRKQEHVGYILSTSESFENVLSDIENFENQYYNKA